MRRRAYIAALGGAAVWPLAMRIGVIGIIALMLAAVTQAVAEDTANGSAYAGRTDCRCSLSETGTASGYRGNPESRTAEGLSRV